MQSLYTARVERGVDTPDSSSPSGQKAVEQMLLSWATWRYRHSYYDEPLLLRSCARILAAEVEVVAVSDPRAALERLRAGGRMVLPLTMAMGATLGKGVVAKIVRGAGGFAAQVITFVAIYSCTSVRDAQIEPLLAKALSTGALFKMKSVRLDAHESGETCVLHGRDVCLSSA